MSELLVKLRNDHRNMSRLLTILSRQIDRIEQGALTDPDLLEAVATYCLDYPDLFHHPHEEHILERLRSVAPEAAANLGDLRDQHLALSAAARDFASLVRQLAAEALLPRDQVVADLRRFVERYRQHIDWEESEFFPQAERCLGAEDWAQLQSERPDGADPLFGSQVAQTYRAIKDEILRNG